MEDLHETIIEMDIPLSTLRLMHMCAARTLAKWPGGDPGEQVELEELRDGLWVVLMSALYETDQI